MMTLKLVVRGIAASSLNFFERGFNSSTEREREHTQPLLIVRVDITFHGRLLCVPRLEADWTSCSFKKCIIKCFFFSSVQGELSAKMENEFVVLLE